MLKIPYFYVEHILLYMPISVSENINLLIQIYFQVASFLLYLSDVEEGGETMFPFEVRKSLSLEIFCSHLA